MTSMKVLVTGGTGHLGSAIVELLEERSHDVRVLARHPGDDPVVEWVQGDLATGEGVRPAVAGAETVIHAATNSPAARRGGFRPLPTDVRMQAVDSDDFAKFVVQCATDGRRGEREDFAGPEALTMRELAEQFLAARGLRKRIWNAPVPQRIQSALEAGNTSPAARRGTTTWAEWLRRSGAAPPATIERAA